MNRLWKWTRSFFIREWNLEDYPVRVRLRPDGPRPVLSPTPPWTAQIEGWWLMAGFGQSRAQALADLAAKFNDHCYHGHPLHRPGAEVPITLGTYQDEVMEHEEEDKKHSNG